MPPSVETANTAGKGFNGLEVNHYAEDTVRQLLEGVTEVVYPGNEKVNRGTREDLDALFNAWNGVV